MFRKRPGVRCNYPLIYCTKPVFGSRQPPSRPIVHFTAVRFRCPTYGCPRQFLSQTITSPKSARSSILSIVIKNASQGNRFWNYLANYYKYAYSAQSLGKWNKSSCACHFYRFDHSPLKNVVKTSQFSQHSQHNGLYSFEFRLGRARIAGV